MIDKNSYVIILGAGASMPYKFPSGESLYHIVKEEVENYVKEYFNNPRVIKYDSQELLNDAESFSSALKSAEGVSIDKFVNLNRKFEKIGKRAIATAIIKSENIANLPIENRNVSDNWYSYIFKKMIEGLNTADELLEIYKNRISFITFNYDRSLENYLFQNLNGLLKNSGKSQEEIIECTKKIDIAHVYGQIGLLSWQADEEQKNLVLEYGKPSGSAFENADRISPMIEIMYEERQKSQEIAAIQEKVACSKHIIFLGFGFDSDNIRILGLPSDSSKKITGTAYQNTINEILSLENRLHRHKVVLGHARSLHDCNCTQLLRDHLQ